MHLPFLENQSEPPYKTTNKLKRTIIILLAVLTLGAKASAQDWSLSTNLIDYVCLGTLNAEGSVAAGRYLSVNASVRYNPWTFQKGDPAKQMQNRNQTYAAGVRYWPWHIYSGWWFSGGPVHILPLRRMTGFKMEALLLSSHGPRY